MNSEMLEEDGTYHIYNRANGSENLFREVKNYYFFLKKYFYHIHPVAETFAWCLLPNHFHMMVRIRPEQEAVKNINPDAIKKYECYGKFVSKRFANLFSSYTQAVNKVYGRTGSLFQPNMKRKNVGSDEYFTKLILYIHNNPVKHGFVKSAWDWPYSSIHQFSKLSKSLELLESCTQQSVINWFGNLKEFESAHAENTHIGTGIHELTGS